MATLGDVTWAQSLDLPFQILRTDCSFPVAFRLEDGNRGAFAGGAPVAATLGTTLAGAFGRALLDVACRRPASPCGLGAKGIQCRVPRRCVASCLHKPFSQVMQRSLASPVLLRASPLVAEQAVRDLELEIVLLGRAAIECADLVVDAVSRMGERGLGAGQARRQFHLSGVAETAVSTIGEWVSKLRAIGADHALLRLQTPYLHKCSPHLEDDQARAEHLLRGMLESVAYELVAFDLEDRGAGVGFGRRARDELASSARAAAAESCASLRIGQAALKTVDLGRRRSRTNHRSFPVRGVEGFMELSQLDGALPWIVAATLCRAGQRRSLGFGQVELWLPGPGVVRPAPVDSRACAMEAV